MKKSEPQSQRTPELSSELKSFLKDHGFNTIFDYRPSAFPYSPGQSPISEAIIHKPQLAEELLRNGIPINQKCDGARTPLGLAAHYSRTSLCELMVALGADIDIIPGKLDMIGHEDLFEGRSPLLLACTPVGGPYAEVTDSEDVQFAIKETRMNKAFETVEMLLDKGANVNHADEENETALFHSIYTSRKISRLLIDRGIDIYARNEEGQTALQEVFSGFKPILFYKDPFKDTRIKLDSTMECMAPDVDAVRDLAATFIQRYLRKAKCSA